jgi:hypothetical protein
MLSRFGLAGQNNPTLSLLQMLKSSMQKEPKIIAEKFHSIFTTRVQLSIIGGLLGIIAMRMMGL